MIISVIIPIYNVKSYIKECLDSLINQDINKDLYEIICIDDGSTDGSGKILDEFSVDYPNIRVVHKANGGVSSARNEGIKIAKGEYIWFVDGDDIVIHNTFSGIIECLKEKSPDLLFVKPIAFKDGIDTSIYKTNEIESDDTTKQYYDWLWTRFIKRELIVKSGIRFNTKLALSEDHMFCTLLNPYIKKVDTYNKVVYCYRIRANSASTTETKYKIDNLISTCKEFIDLRKDKSIDTTVIMNEVCANLITIMAYTAKLPSKDANIILDKLKALGLFPLKKQKHFTYDKSEIQNLSFDDRILLKLKYISYTKRGYYLLRVWRMFLKIKRRIF